MTFETVPLRIAGELYCQQQTSKREHKGVTDDCRVLKAQVTRRWTSHAEQTQQAGQDHAYTNGELQFVAFEDRRGKQQTESQKEIPGNQVGRQSRREAVGIVEREHFGDGLAGGAAKGSKLHEVNHSGQTGENDGKPERCKTKSFLLRRRIRMYRGKESNQRRSK